jgi:hypothetical protein
MISKSKSLTGTINQRFFYGFGQSAPAIQIAIQHAQAAGIATNFEFQLVSLLMHIFPYK